MQPRLNSRARRTLYSTHILQLASVVASLLASRSHCQQEASLQQNSSHFPKKNIIIIVAYEGQEGSSTEEPEDEEKQKEEIKQWSVTHLGFKKAIFVICCKLTSSIHNCFKPEIQARPYVAMDR